MFAPQRMQELEASLTSLVNELIDAFVDDDEIDFAKQFSMPFPSHVFLTLFGLPLDELPRFIAMKDGIIRPDQVVGEPRGHPETDSFQQATADEVYAYFEQLIAERATVRRDDLIGRLLDADGDGDRLGLDEIVDICFLFLIAGLDTVSASLDCFFGYLGRNPAARRHVVAHPDAIPDIIEELLRWETPVMAVSRVATRDTEVGGCPVAAGEPVMALLGAANLDDAEFQEAGDVRFDRDVNRHLAFGGGIHRCLGSHLARLELRVAVREWHRRLPEFPMLLGSTTD
jgi:cytochrome P450